MTANRISKSSIVVIFKKQNVYTYIEDYFFFSNSFQCMFTIVMIVLSVFFHDYSLKFESTNLRNTDATCSF